MLLKLDFSIDTPIYQQIRNQIVRGIAAGDLAPGQQLPPIRVLAEECGINMMTVSKAYTLLKQDGYIQTDRRCGTTVSPIHPAGMADSVQEKLLLALSEAKAAGASEEELIAMVKEVFA